MNRHQFIPDELLEFFAKHADVNLLAQKARWALDRRCMDAFAGDLREKLLPELRGNGFYSVFTWNLAPSLVDGLAQQGYDAEAAKGSCAYFVLPENPNTYAIECSGQLPAIAQLVEGFGHDTPSDLVIVDAALTWTFVLHRERDGSTFGRARRREEEP